MLLLPRHSVGARRRLRGLVHRLQRPRGASRKRLHAHRLLRRHAGSSRYVCAGAGVMPCACVFV